jgi:transposase
MLKDGTLYQDLGADPFDKRHKTASTRRLVQRLQNLGFAVQLTPAPA